MTNGATNIWKSALNPAFNAEDEIIHLGRDVVDCDPFQARQASHVDLDTSSDVYLKHDALNDRHLENISASLQGADVGNRQRTPEHSKSTLSMADEWKPNHMTGRTEMSNFCDMWITFKTLSDYANKTFLR